MQSDREAKKQWEEVRFPFPAVQHMTAAFADAAST